MRVKHYLISLLLCFSTLAIAQVSGIDSSFKTDAANKTLEKYSAINTSSRSSISQLQNASAGLTKLEAQAKKCVDENSISLEKINKRLTEITGAQSKTSVVTAEEKYLNGKKEALVNQLSECQLFILRSDDLENNIALKLRSLLRNELLYPEASITDNLLAIPTGLNEFYTHFDSALFIEQSGIGLFTVAKTIFLTLLLVIGIILSIKSRSMLRKHISHQTETHFAAQVKQAFFCTLQKYVIPLIPFAILTLFFTAHSPNLSKAPYLTLISCACLGYIVYLIVIHFLIAPPKPAQSFSSLPATLAKKFMRRLVLLGDLCLSAYILYVVFMPQNPPDTVHDFAATVFITLVTINLIAIIWLVKRLPTLLYHHGVIRLFFSIILTIGLVAVLITEWLGYHLLAHYLLVGIAMTVLIIFLSRMAFKLIGILSESLTGTENQWQQTFRGALGLKRNDRLLEVLLLRVLLYFLTWCALLLALLKVWGLAQTNFHIVLNALIQGMHIGNFIFIPSRITTGILFFIVLMVSTRILRNYTAKKTNLHLTQGNRDSLAAIVGYIGFAIALLIGLLIAGVDFSGLAIIAGALSVGIGFGLQNIVNNFVSGIILLIERPIKPGDRIIVGDTEGYVRRISIRSTHIITTKRADVIVPNSELIAKQVTNYMLYDTNYKVSTTVGIAYGSNVELAKQILLDVARAHPEVLTERSIFHPEVFFRRFGDNSLEFELQCVIKDVEKKSEVVSELNFAIDKAFREHQINIAFPQRDIRILGEFPAKKQDN